MKKDATMECKPLQGLFLHIDQLRIQPSRFLKNNALMNPALQQNHEKVVCKQQIHEKKH